MRGSDQSHIFCDSRPRISIYCDEASQSTATRAGLVPTPVPNGFACDAHPIRLLGRQASYPRPYLTKLSCAEPTCSHAIRLLGRPPTYAHTSRIRIRCALDAPTRQASFPRPYLTNSHAQSPLVRIRFAYETGLLLRPMLIGQITLTGRPIII